MFYVKIPVIVFFFLLQQTLMSPQTFELALCANTVSPLGTEVFSSIILCMLIKFIQATTTWKTFFKAELNEKSLWGKLNYFLLFFLVKL